MQSVYVCFCKESFKVEVSRVAKATRAGTVYLAVKPHFHEAFKQGARTNFATSTTVAIHIIKSITV